MGHVGNGTGFRTLTKGCEEMLASALERLPTSRQTAW